jgi:type IV pilus assembly protein PilX
MTSMPPSWILRQRGVVLVTSLLLLIVVTLLAVGMFRSFGLDEKIAGNVREKQRALNAAETAEQYAEYWLSNNANAVPVTCSTTSTSTIGAQVCVNPLPTIVPNNDVTLLPWTVAATGSAVGTTYTYSPAGFGMTILSSGANNFYAAPAFYISLLGTSNAGGNSATVYQIDAVGYGGSPDTAAVVESTYSITSSTTQCVSCN